MAYQDDPNGKAAIDDLLRRVRKLEAGSPLGNSSITEGGLRVASNEGLVVEGSQKVSGTLNITGILTGIGSFIWNGIVTLTSVFTANGPWNLNGVGTITGNSTQTGDMTVSGGGRINVGGLVLNPSLNGYGGLSAGSSIYLNAPITVSNGILTGHDLYAAGGTLSIDTIGTSTSAANMFINTSGTVLKSTSAARFKIDARPMDLPDALLDVPVKEWIDRNSAERIAALLDAPRPFTFADQHAWDAATLDRVPGIIAEEVEAAGGSQFVGYNADGEIESVAYDRLALARTEILARKLDAALARIEQLERSA